MSLESLWPKETFICKFDYYIKISITNERVLKVADLSKVSGALCSYSVFLLFSREKRFK